LDPTPWKEEKIQSGSGHALYNRRREEGSLLANLKKEGSLIRAHFWLKMEFFGVAFGKLQIRGG
jgi:hypothetical protein